MAADMSVADVPLPWLVADIGGTNARFALVHEADGDVTDVRSMRCADYPSAADAALAYLDEVGALRGATPQPAIAAFAVATPIHGDTVTLTNSRWTISASATAAALGAQTLHLFNDFEALALALPRLAARDLLPLQIGGKALPNRSLPMTVIGPGTGLGVATCVPAGERHWLPLPGEGGHVTLSAADDFEAELLRVLRLEFDHVSAERVLSGIGLPSLHGAVRAVRGAAPLAQPLTPEQIATAALDGSDAHCLETLETFAAMLGGFAGNVALTVGARGGVFVAGGIAQRLGPFLQRSRFRARFEDKGRFRSYLAPIATHLITFPHAALVGAAEGITHRLYGARLG
jgi:glucokinase